MMRAAMAGLLLTAAVVAHAGIAAADAPRGVPEVRADCTVEHDTQDLIALAQGLIPDHLPPQDRCVRIDHALSNGVGILDLAAFHGNRTLARKLIAAGADVEGAGGILESALDGAHFRGGAAGPEDPRDALRLIVELVNAGADHSWTSEGITVVESLLVDLCDADASAKAFAPILQGIDPERRTPLQETEALHHLEVLAKAGIMDPICIATVLSAFHD